MPNVACHLVDANVAFTYCLSSCWSLFFNVVATDDAVYVVAYADGIYDLVTFVIMMQLSMFNVVATDAYFHYDVAFTY